MNRNTRWALLGLVVILGGAFAFWWNFKSHSDEKSIVVVVPSYNNKAWYKKNLDSIFSQKYHNFRVIYTDDASPDGTGDLVKEYIREKNVGDRITLIQNKERVGSLANLYKMIQSCNKDDIIVDLDGDDWLAFNGVLSYLNKMYSDPNVWMTYGQFLYYPANTMGFASKVPADVIEQNTFRSLRNGAITHLRTFYAGLFQKIKKEDLMHEGQFFQISGDMAFLLPISEMAGKHSKFIPITLYIYNASNPISDDRTNRPLQVKMENVIRAKEKYEPLADL